MPAPTAGRRRLLAIVGGAALSLVTAMGGVQAGADAPVDLEVEAPVGPLAGEMAQLLETQPGGVQVSDNAMAWDGGTVMVWPSPGEAAAPAGLGANVRVDVVQELGIEHLAEPEPASGEASTMGSASTCPSGYYCFYTGTNFDGSRLQFSSTCSGHASSWGFDNTTSSWVNRNGGKVVYAYDYKGGPYLWTMSPGASSSYVGSADNNRMGYWLCRYV